MLRALLDTNILIHREAATVVKQDIGTLFHWLDKLGYVKCIHPISIQEIDKHDDDRVRKSFQIKLASYTQLKTLAALHSSLAAVVATDKTENDKNDTLILNELCADRVDLLITEDRRLRNKAAVAGVSARVFTVEAFLEKVNAENPALADYKVLAIKKKLFGTLNIGDQFFDSFRRDYGGDQFDRWFNKKSDEPAYVCLEGDKLVAFLFLKVESKDERYGDIEPPFKPARRLKIGTFKVELNGFKLGERFLKIVFDNALSQAVDQVYVTIFEKTIEQQRLVELLQEFGFVRHGTKKNAYGEEQVFVRSMLPAFNAADPKLSFPFVSRSSRCFLVPIYPEYHTSLLPDSILNNESPQDFVEQLPHRNAIRKVYISRSHFRNLASGDTLVFYRTGGFHKSVVTTLGIVEDVHLGVRSETEFIELCRKRSVFTDAELKSHWNWSFTNRPFIVGFAYAYALPKRPNLKSLIENGVIKDVNSAPRGFEQISAQQFDTVLALAQANKRIIVD